MAILLSIDMRSPRPRYAPRSPYALVEDVVTVVAIVGFAAVLGVAGVESVDSAAATAVAVRSGPELTCIAAPHVGAPARATATL